MDLRRSMLFIPGNNPAMLQNGGIFGADSIILDLEDAVAPGEKDAARFLVAETLREVDYGTSE
ncbi:MAG: CoA ester lyase, partial [Pelosinus sp.]|nr:CoA ester lyase [Pelosinus sp.]